MTNALPLVLFAIACFLMALYAVPLPEKINMPKQPKAPTAEVKLDIGDMYRDEADESQRIIAELTSDVRLFACPEAFIVKVNRLAEIWGIEHRDKAN